MIHDDFVDRKTGAVCERQGSLLIHDPRSDRKALELKALLEKHTKSRGDHRRIGRFLGYSRKAIREFLARN